MISGTNAYLETYLEKALLWLECLHHILELIAAAAVTLKLGPSSGPKDKVFGQFEQWFNSLTEEEIEKIIAGEFHDQGQARTGRGIHRLPKVSCGPAMPDPYTPCRRATPPKWPYGRLGGGPPAGWFAACSRLPPKIPLPVRAWLGRQC
jgi:hypothetical protein